MCPYARVQANDRIAYGGKDLERNNAGETRQGETVKNNKPKRSRAWIRVLAEFLLCGALLVGIGYQLMQLKGEYAKAQEELENNRDWSTVERLQDGSIHVCGVSNGNSYDYIEDGRILPGVSIAGIPMGGMNYEEARQALLDDFEDRISKINIRANVKDTTLVLNAANFNISTSRDLNELIHEALKVGRGEDKDYYTVYTDRQHLAETGLDFGDYSLEMDDSGILSIISSVAELVNTVPKEPYITVLNRVGGGKPGVGVGGDASDIEITRTVYAPNGTPMADMQFHSGKNGSTLNQEDMLNQITEAFYSGNYDAELTLRLEETEPDSTAQELADSISEISRFNTRFASSSDVRARNVQKAAGLLHCVIMDPGVDYSYNEILGPRYESDGWLPAPAISGGREYIDSPGGGICQVSTTLYNALLQIGSRIHIVRRFHHSIPGSYIDMGLDATVSYGGPDLVWRNEGETPMLLFAYADMSRRAVYAIIYGTPNENGVSYRVYSETVETIEPDETIRVPEPMWPTGYSKMVVSPRTGYNVDVYRQMIDADGNDVGEPEFLYQDKYVPVTGELHYGTGPASLPKPQ